MSTLLRFAVIGSPIAHSKSPAMHEAAYRALGLPHVYEKILTSEAEVELRVSALRAGTFAGLNATVPHKTAVLALADEVDPSAAATGAANTLVRVGDGRVRAHNTDAPALAAELVPLAGGRERFRGRSALVLGTGGAARAAVFALGSLGVDHVVVRGRSETNGLAAVLAAANPRAAFRFEPLGSPRSGERSDLVAVVQATTAGMTGTTVPGSVAVDAVHWPTVPRDAVVLDVVYSPARTPLLVRAAAEGLATEGGLGMLVRQGALAFELWLGIAPPLEAMRAALAR